MRLLTLLLLLLAAPAWAQWSSTYDVPCAGMLKSYGGPLSVTMTDAGTYYQMTGFPINEGYSTGAGYVTTYPGVSDGIDIGVNCAGLYFAKLSGSFYLSAGTELHCEVWKEGVDQELAFRDDVANANDYATSGVGGLVMGVVDGDTFTIQCEADDAGRTINWDHLILSVFRIGP